MQTSLLSRLTIVSALLPVKKIRKYSSAERLILQNQLSGTVIVSGNGKMHSRLFYTIFDRVVSPDIGFEVFAFLRHFLDSSIFQFK